MPDAALTPYLAYKIVLIQNVARFGHFFLPVRAPFFFSPPLPYHLPTPPPPPPPSLSANSLLLSFPAAPPPPLVPSASRTLPTPHPSPLSTLLIHTGVRPRKGESRPGLNQAHIIFSPHPGFSAFFVFIFSLSSFLSLQLFSLMPKGAHSLYLSSPLARFGFSFPIFLPLMAEADAARPPFRRARRYSCPRRLTLHIRLPRIPFTLCFSLIPLSARFLRAGLFSQTLYSTQRKALEMLFISVDSSLDICVSFFLNFPRSPRPFLLLMVFLDFFAMTTTSKTHISISFFFFGVILIYFIFHIVK